MILLKILKPPKALVLPLKKHPTSAIIRVWSSFSRRPLQGKIFAKHWTGTPSWIITARLTFVDLPICLFLYIRGNLYYLWNMKHFKNTLQKACALELLREVTPCNSINSSTKQTAGWCCFNWSGLCLFCHLGGNRNRSNDPNDRCVVLPCIVSHLFCWHNLE